MVGMRFCPCIRSLHRQRIYCADPARDHGAFEPVLKRGRWAVNFRLIAERWDRIGQFYAAFPAGHATASAALQRLNRFQASNRFYAASGVTQVCYCDGQSLDRERGYGRSPGRGARLGAWRPPPGRLGRAARPDRVGRSAAGVAAARPAARGRRRRRRPLRDAVGWIGRCRSRGLLARLLGRGQHDALDRQQSLVDLPDRDLHVAESFVHAVEAVLDPVHSTAQAGAQAADLRGQQSGHNPGRTTPVPISHFVSLLIVARHPSKYEIAGDGRDTEPGSVRRFGPSV